jgi:hypothetical protein
VTFIRNEDKPLDPEIIYNEVNFVPAGLDSFFALQYVTTIHNELSESDPLHSVSRYDVGTSAINLIPGANATWGRSI